MEKSYDAKTLYHIYYNLMRRKDVTVCSAWKNSYKAFSQWCVAHGYCEGARIVRIDKTKPYQPSNTKIVCNSYAKNMKRLVKMTKNKPIKHIKVKMRNNGN